MIHVFVAQARSSKNVVVLMSNIGWNKEKFKNQPRVNPNPKGLDFLLKKHGVELKPQVIDKLWEYHCLVRENNEDGDLTRLRAFETMVERHYADCTIINAFVEEWPERMLDIGSGAGFPGFPLKIVNPQIKLTLCEPRPKRVEFLNMVIEKLNLKDIDVFGHKATSNSLIEPVDGVITRAFEVMDKTLLRIDKALKPGGRAIFMKGPAVREELKVFKNDEYTIEAEHFYTIPNSTQDRALIILRRNK
jgi:16S rRNA (guanine527-N7)-methyltransferase